MTESSTCSPRAVDSAYRLNYLETREEDCCLGTGIMVEGGAWQYQSLFLGSGIRWSWRGEDHLAPICTAILLGRFADVWQNMPNSPQS